MLWGVLCLTIFASAKMSKVHDDAEICRRVQAGLGQVWCSMLLRRYGRYGFMSSNTIRSG